MTRWLVGRSWQSVVLAMIWLACGAAGWLAWGPVPQPITFTGKVTVQPDAVPPGGVVVMTREFIVKEPVAVTVTRNLIALDGQKRPAYILPESRTLWSPGHYDQQRAHQIPEYVVPGRYKLDVVASWPVNPLRVETKQLAPVEFTVVPK